jgi:nucleotide sugar dehydrogenase
LIDAVGVIGLGVVGGTVARAFSEAGLTVHGYDRYLNLGAPELLAACRVVFMCVPTPSLPTRGHDLSEVWSAAREIEPHMEPGSLVVVKSTVSPGTNDRLAAALPRVEFASVPEFLVAARPFETFTQPDRIIVGARSSEAATMLCDLFARVAPEAPPVVVKPIEAELAKLFSNGLLAAKVSMANQLSEVCDRYQVSWPRVKAVIGLDRRIGPDHLTVTPERGFGGSCLPKDLDALISVAESVGCRTELLKAVADFNRYIRSSAEDDSASGNGSRSLVVNGSQDAPHLEISKVRAARRHASGEHRAGSRNGDDAHRERRGRLP